MTVYTFPNLVSFEQRGSINERARLMHKYRSQFGCHDFRLVEMPGDFVKNKTEEKKTKLKIGAMITTGEHVSVLYSKDESVDLDSKYILHTEPGLWRKGTIKARPHLSWFDRDWRKRFLEHIFCIIKYLGHTPYAIEVHPGERQGGKNCEKDLVKGIAELNDEHKKRYQEQLLIFMENRTGQIINSGSAISAFWNTVKNDFPDAAAYCGLVLDVQQLYTGNKDTFIDELGRIPPECLIGCHIHTKHQTPSVNDPIDWKAVGLVLSESARELHVLPEVHRQSQVSETYRFCKEVLRL